MTDTAFFDLNLAPALTPTQEEKVRSGYCAFDSCKGSVLMSQATCMSFYACGCNKIYVLDVPEKPA